MAYAVIRYRHRHGRQAKYEPENRKLEWWLTGLTAVGIAALLAPGLTVWAKFVTVPNNASIVEVLGQQWSWSYRFPGTDGHLGASDASLITLDNPFGMDPNDAAGKDDVLVSSQELHLPIDVPVKVLLRSKDVNHQFAVPQFRVKMDMVPGMVTFFWFTPIRTGEFDALCEQLCGVAHFAMRGRVIVDEKSTFDGWLKQQPTYSQLQAQIAGDPHAGQTLYTTCTACHGPQAQGNESTNAPKLSGQASWYLTRQLNDFKQGQRGAGVQDIFGKQMTVFAATLPDDQAIRNVVAYIATLQDQRVENTLAGDAEHGKSLYTTCESCHGANGQGIWATNAPRLAGMSDWYLARQLDNFRKGIRGAHRQDFHGSQMASMAQMLTDEKAVNDVVAYIRTL
jgi:cytochrome c oxidase subunit 2